MRWRDTDKIIPSKCDLAINNLALSLIYVAMSGIHQSGLNGIVLAVSSAEDPMKTPEGHLESDNNNLWPDGTRNLTFWT